MQKNSNQHTSRCTVLLAYISPLRYPSEKAGSLFSMKSCEAFAREGIAQAGSLAGDSHDGYVVELWVPWRRNKLAGRDPFEYYGIERIFKIRKFPALDLTGFMPGAFKILSYTFAVSVILYSWYLAIKKWVKSNSVKSLILYSHEQYVLAALSAFSFNNTFYEMHDYPGSTSGARAAFRKLFTTISGIISTNSWKSKRLVTDFESRVPNIAGKILTVPNAVDLKEFAGNISVVEARRELDLAQETYFIGYVGALRTMGMDKGIDILIDSLEFLPSHCSLYIIGGETADICYYVSYAEKKGVRQRIVFAGSVSHAHVELHMSACNVLVAPYPRTEHYSHYMSPMKIFEYMASGRPMVVTDLPSVREIVDETCAVFSPPDDARALAGAIQYLVQDPQRSSAFAARARERAEHEYTWSQRAKKIITFLERK
jgi:glycosyltransferase involved in cell wall biosynthesis